MAEEELVGHISKLEDGYAFAVTDKGTVFIPISAARLNKDTLNSLKEKFAYRDEVRITAVPQKTAKNGCSYLAKKVRAKNTDSSTELSTEIYGPVLARVTSTESGFAFAQSDEFGTIFVPGDAFDGKIVKSVNGYIQVGSQLALQVQEQREVNNCKWIAVKAVRHFEMSLDEVCSNNVITSCANVIGVSETEVLLYDEKHRATVRCSQLTYIGGLRGKRNVNSLLDLITEEEAVMYKAEMTSAEEWNAIEWKQVTETNDSLVLKKVATTDSTSQTAPCLLALMVRTMFKKYPEEVENFKPFFEHLPNAALPEDYLLERERQTFENTQLR